MHNAGSLMKMYSQVLIFMKKLLIFEERRATTCINVCNMLTLFQGAVSDNKKLNIGFFLGTISFRELNFLHFCSLLDLFYAKLLA